MVVLSALLTVLAMTGCGQGDVDLAGRSFTSTGTTGHDLVQGSAVTLSFEGENMAATAGCNTITGSVSTADDTLTFDSQAASTMMACEPDLMVQDQWLTDFLTSKPSLRVEGDTMTLDHEGTSITLTEGG